MAEAGLEMVDEHARVRGVRDGEAGISGQRVSVLPKPEVFAVRAVGLKKER